MMNLSYNRIRRWIAGLMLAGLTVTGFSVSQADAQNMLPAENGSITFAVAQNNSWLKKTIGDLEVNNRTRLEIINMIADRANLKV